MDVLRTDEREPFVTLDGSEIRRDCVVIPPGVEHQLVNDGAEPLVLVCCCAPPYSHEDTVVTTA